MNNNFLDKRVMILISLIISLIVVNTVNNVSAKGGNISDSLLRVHIIANSDSEYDQARKMEIKSKVMEYINSILEEKREINNEINNEISKEVNNKIDNKVIDNEINKNSDLDLKSMIDLIQDNLKNIESISDDLKANIVVKNYPLKIESGKIISPGYYYSLEIVIGEGKGHNWWQALYPDLAYTSECVSNIDNKDINESTSNDIKYDFKILYILGIKTE